MSALVASLARRIGDTAEFVHRSAQPVDSDGASSHPSFLKQSLDDIHHQVVNGRAFRLEDVVSLIYIL